jgi:large subunit ribosomal protein L9
MKLILTSRVSNLGTVGDVVEVKNGYGKNFLIPQKKAMCFTVNSRALFEAKKQGFENQNQKNIDSSNQIQNKISNQTIFIIQNASDDGRLYGSVNTSAITKKINELLGSNLIAKTNIFLKKPIKEVGIYSVKLDLHSDVVFEMKLVVAKTESEAETLLNPKSVVEEKTEEENFAKPTKQKVANRRKTEKS